MNKKFVYPALGLLLITVGVLAGFKIKEFSPSMQQAEAKIEKIEEVIRLVNENYFDVPDNNKLVDDAIIGMLAGLDPHTFYIPASDLKSINEQMQGSFEGIGVEFNIVDDTLYVVTPISGGPSDKVGIHSGDKIVKIDGENVAGIGLTNNDVFKRLRGKKGTQVKVSIRRTGVKDLIDFEIIRDKIPLNSVDFSYMLDKKTGYIKVNRFAETTMREFIQHLTQLKNNGMENLVLDLRNNPGGYLEMAQMMSDVFLSEGKKIVYTKGRVKGTDKTYESTSRINDFETGGLVILINEGSASASEIVSGAVQDWDRGLVVGTRSFGKGLVQHQYNLSDESAIRVVISRYYTPSGRCIQKPYNKGNKNYDLEVMKRYENGEVFDESKVNFPDSLKYKTNAGRTVYGGGGIMPDVFIAVDTTGKSEYLTNLLIKDVFRKFAVKYVDENPNIKSQYQNGFEYAQNFDITDKMLKDFTTFANDKGVSFNEKDYKHSKRHIIRNLKALIGRSLFQDEGFYPVLHANDNQLQKALSLIPEAKKLEKTGVFRNN